MELSEKELLAEITWMREALECIVDQAQDGNVSKFHPVIVEAKRRLEGGAYGNE